MNVLLILSALKKGWEYTKGFLDLALKYGHIVFITLMLIINSSLRDDIVDLNKEKDTLNRNIVLLVQKQQQDLLEAQEKAQEKEIEILTKQKEVEVKYTEQIKALSNNVAIVRNSANSLSKQLTKNASMLSKLTEKHNRVYSETATELPGKCETKYLDMAGEADAKRLAEARCVGLYNTLVDGVDDVDNPDTNNKE